MSGSMAERKIIYLLEFWRPPGWPASTGGTLYNYKLVEAWSTEFDVEIVALNMPSKQTPIGVCLRQFEESHHLLAPWRFAAWRRTLLREITRHPKSAIVVTTSATNAVLKDAKKEGYTVVAVVQAYEDFGLSVPTDNFFGRIRNAKRLLATAQGLRGSLAFAESILVNSDYMDEAVGVAFGADTTRFRIYPPLCMPIRKVAHFDPLALRTIGFVNRAGKNLRFVLMLAASMPDLPFVIFGHRTPEVRRLPRNVQFMGWTSDREDMFSQAYTWLVPSSWQEPFGLVALEALSQGCRVAVSKRGGLPEAVGRFGQVFSDFDITSWRRWIHSGKRDEVVEMNNSCFSHLERFSSTAFERNALKFARQMFDHSQRSQQIRLRMENHNDG